MPNGRTELYAIWRACERLNLRPPGVKAEFDKNDVVTQSHILSYAQIRDLEDVKLAALGRAP